MIEFTDTAIFKTKTSSRIKWEEVLSQTIIYEDVPCYPYQPKWGLKLSDEALNYKSIDWKVLIWPEYDIKQNMICVLRDIEYKVLTMPKPNYFHWNELDSYEFYIWR